MFQRVKALILPMGSGEKTWQEYHGKAVQLEACLALMANSRLRPEFKILRPEPTNEEPIEHRRDNQVVRSIPSLQNPTRQPYHGTISECLVSSLQIIPTSVVDKPALIWRWNCTGQQPERPSCLLVADVQLGPLPFFPNFRCSTLSQRMVWLRLSVARLVSLFAFFAYLGTPGPQTRSTGEMRPQL